MRAFLVFFLFLQVSPAWAWPGITIRVIDGDTLTIRGRQETIQRIRLYGIDCPEGNQPWGHEAAEAAWRLTEGRVLEVDEQYQDRYGRTVAILLLSEGGTVQEALLDAGAAWVAPRYCKRPECREWMDREQNARMERRGLWQYPQPVPPWEWRKRNQ